MIDTSVHTIIQNELRRQQNQIELIASENIVSVDVLRAQGSIMTNKYAEGYPGRRYYNGCTYMDDIESLARDRVKSLFGCAYANVQPHSGAQANLAVFLALLEPGDTFMGMDLDCGGHLTHGSSVNVSGKWFNPVCYDVDKETHLMNYDALEAQALKHRPKLIIAGGSAYPRTIDFERMRAIADKVDAYFMVDMAHFAGLVAGGVFPSPLPHAHIVTSTTHKTLRGPRGGIILSNDTKLGKKINSAVFPGMQGGPLMHVIAAKAVAFGEALNPQFKAYAAQVISNAKVLANTLASHGLSIVSGGTDSHLVLVDVSPFDLTGAASTDALEAAHIACNKNTVPFDSLGPLVTSGLRLGTPACTTRGFKEDDFEAVGDMIASILKVLSLHKGDIAHPACTDVQEGVREKVHALCKKYPIYEDLAA